MNFPTDPSTLDLAERIDRACSYPFARPACSYLFVDGAMQPLSKEMVAGRAPVLASGSNAAPSRLAAKFGRSDGMVPVTRAILHDFVVVFAGHFTGYGAIPATLCPHPGAATNIWITWLTQDQLMIMHRSEGVIGCREMEQRYDYVELRDLDLRPESLPAITEAGGYLSRRMLAPSGQPLRFAEVFSKGCSLKAWPQRAALHLAHQHLDPRQSFEGFMSAVLSGPHQRQKLFQTLKDHSVER